MEEGKVDKTISFVSQLNEYMHTWLTADFPIKTTIKRVEEQTRGFTEADQPVYVHALDVKLDGYWQSVEHSYL